MRNRLFTRIILLGIVLLGVAFSASLAQNEVKIQLVLVMDGSGSISAEDFRTMIEATAKGVSDPAVIPQNGLVEIALVQFSHLLSDPKVPGAKTELAFTPVTITTVSEIARRIRDIRQPGGFTPLSQGIRLATELIKEKPRPGARQVFNVITDGNPNLPGGPDQAKDEARKARDEAVAAGLEQLDAEGIGDALTEPDFVDFLKSLVWPQPGVLVDINNNRDNFPPKGQNGFVVMVKKFADFEKALRQKLVFTISEPPVADPGPIPDGKPDTQPYLCNVGQTITLDGSGSFDPDGPIAKYEWDFNNDGTVDATGPKVQFTCPNTVGTVTFKLTVVDATNISATATQKIEVKPAPPPNQNPIAVCSSIDETIVGVKVQVDGSGSSDPEGKALTYQWSFKSKPAESQVVFEDPASAKTSFTPDKVGTYTVQLSVRDPEGATGTCEMSVVVRKSFDTGKGDELGAMKRAIVEFGRTLPLSAILGKLRLAVQVAEGFGADQRARALAEETQEMLNELLESAGDMNTLLAFLTAGAEKMRVRIEAFVTANTISAERANLIKKAIDRFSDYVESAEERVSEVEDAINEALSLLDEALEDPDSVDITKLAEARDKLLSAFAQWRGLLNGAIVHIDKISAQLRAALKLADRRKRWRLVKSDVEPFMELRAGAHRVHFVPTISPRWSVQNCGGCAVKVAVYALNGRQIATQESLGPTLILRWPQAPANDVYWYVLTIETPDGGRVQSLGKWVHLR